MFLQSFWEAGPDWVCVGSGCSWCSICWHQRCSYYTWAESSAIVWL